VFLETLSEEELDMANINETRIEKTSITALPGGRLSASSAAAYLGRSVSTLASWRSRGCGPPFVKQGQIIYYLADLENWLNEGRVVTSKGQARERCD
jgi:hypothetical protein